VGWLETIANAQRTTFARTMKHMKQLLSVRCIEFSLVLSFEKPFSFDLTDELTVTIISGNYRCNNCQTKSLSSALLSCLFYLETDRTRKAIFRCFPMKSR